MTSENEPDLISKRFRELLNDAERSGYFLNPDASYTLGLVEGLVTNNKRYGYESCPCRLSMGIIEEDRDIICPCDYRDQDLNEFGTCYCGLYVSGEIARNKTHVKAIPERRPPRNERNKKSGILPTNLPYPVWRCKVCGYLCARENPPEICPVCKAKHDRFERFA